MNANVAARLIERARRHPERLAIVEARRGEGGSVSFGELAARVESVAARMRGEGLRPGAPVLLFVPMSVDLYVALLATFHVGAVAVFLDAWADRARLEAAVKLARPELFIAPAAAHLLRLISPSLRRTPRHWRAGAALRALDRERRGDAGLEGGASSSGRWRFSRADPSAERSAGDDGGAPGHATQVGGPMVVQADSPALVTFTTGSTGAPKAAVRSHRLLWAQHEALAEHLELREWDVDMPTLPIFVLNNLALGITSVIPDLDPRRPAKIDPARIVMQMRAHGVTTSSGSPAFYARLGDWCRERGETLNVRLWTGGAPVYPPLAKLLDEVSGGEAHVVYGSTEAEPIAGIVAAEMARLVDATAAPPGLCCGFPVPQIELKIIRPQDGPIALGPGGWEDWELARGDVGEIVVTGEHVLGAYLHAPEETLRHKIHENGNVWHRTGDAGWLDEEGRLWLMGRVSSRVVRAGVTWWSMPPELRATSVEGVRHAAFVGLSDRGLGERTVLCIEAGKDSRIADLVRAAVSPTPVDELHLLDRIPRDPRHASKTDLPRLRKKIGASG